MNELRSICFALLESVNDKTLALSHQKRANRILAAQICELEQRLENMQGSQMVMFPSKVLLKGYMGSEVDKSGQTENINDTVEEIEKESIEVKATGKFYRLKNSLNKK